MTRRILVNAASIALGSFILCAIVLGGLKMASADTPRMNDPAPAPSTVLVTPVPLPDTVTTEHHGGGRLTVPAQIPPGDYDVTGQDGISHPCYWARVSKLDGKTKSIIAWAWVKRGDPGSFTVLPTDAGVVLRHCTWEQRR